MPEGPSLVLFKEELLPFKGKRITVANGTVKAIDPARMKGRTLKTLHTWGKHLLLYFGSDLSLRVHFLMFGTYAINKKRDGAPQLHLAFDDETELNFYTTSMRYIEQPLEEVYDWRTDVMSKEWDATYVRQLVKAQPPGTLVCDLLLDQDIFTGVGNIIKNETLYRTGIHPETPLGQLPPRKLTELIHEAVHYSEDFLRWRRAYQLRAHLQVHQRSTCPKHGTPLHKGYTGKRKRRSYWCAACQQLY